MRTFDDESATAAFHDGDVAAFDWLAGRYLERATSLARSMLRNLEDAQDLAHEAFVRAWMHRGDLLPGREFAPWFFRIVRNLAVDAIRRRARITNEPLDVRLIARGTAPDVVAHGRLVGARIRVALADLPPQQRRVAALFFLDGCAHAEIAETLSLAEGTVRAHLSFARKRLRRVLAELQPNAA